MFKAEHKKHVKLSCSEKHLEFDTSDSQLENEIFQNKLRYLESYIVYREQNTNLRQWMSRAYIKLVRSYCKHKVVKSEKMWEETQRSNVDIGIGSVIL